MLSSVNTSSNGSNGGSNGSNSNGSPGNANQNHYITAADYLSPMASTTFDSKSSPLALLAQTCSAIGSDAPNPKLIANMEKSQRRDKTSPASNGSPHEVVKSSFKPYESCLKDNNNQHQDAPDDLRVASRIKAQNKPITAAHHHHHHHQLSHHINGNGSTATQSTTSTTSAGGEQRCESTHSASSQHIRKSPPSTSSPKSNHNHLNEKLSNSSASVKSTTPTASESAASAAASLSMKSIESQKEALRNLAAAGSPYPSMPYYGNGFPYPYSMELLSQHQSMLKAAALNPYLNFARMKAAASDMMMAAAAAGICRDPYCTGCSMGSHYMGKNGSSACPPGCQCDHSKASLAANPAALAYHAQLAQIAAQSQMPYVCNWVGPDTSYCGKRFAASDELFQHLRQEHTGNAIPDSLLNASSASTNSLLAALPRAYPTPPLSPLSSARYHPYGKSSQLLPPSTQSQMAAGLMPPHPSLAPYFSPYAAAAALYPRMNSSNLHP